MKPSTILALSAVSATLLFAAPAMAEVAVDVHIGTPPPVVVHQPVVVQPQPVVYVQPAPEPGYWKCNKHNKCKWKKQKHKHHGYHD